MKLNLTDTKILSWLDQFDEDDKLIAASLLSEIHVVSADDLTAGLTEVITRLGQELEGPIALYNEREVRKQHGKPDRLFKEARRKVKRAYGYGPPPVPAGRAYSRTTGSEGVIASLISSIVKTNECFLDHPGPDEIRKKKVRTYLLITDFIGSGKRACSNLEAAWRVHSFKSWSSYGLVNFAVAGFAGMEAGVASVKKHTSRPRVFIAHGCLTIDMLFEPQRSQYKSLCQRYGPPATAGEFTKLGYCDGGALMVFDHGAPNNAPLILHAKSKQWVPLFPRRSIAPLRNAKISAAKEVEIDRALTRMREQKLAASERLKSVSVDEREIVLVLAALKKRPRTLDVLSGRSTLPIETVRQILEQLKQQGFIDAKLRLLTQAYKSFSYLRKSDPPPKPLTKTNDSFYCPRSLRPPVATV